MSRRKSCKKSIQKRRRKSIQKRRKSEQKSCKKSRQRRRKKSTQRSCKKSTKRRLRSCKRSKEDGVKRKRSLLLTEKIPADIDIYEYDVEDNIYDELKPDDLDFLLYDSDVETIPEESLQEYKTLEPSMEISNIFKTLQSPTKKSRRNKLLSEKIPTDIDKYEYDEYDVDDNIYEELKPSDLDFLLHDTEVSDVETIPEESLEEYKTLKPLKKMNESFSRKYYKCPDCKEPQYSRENLTEHFLKVHKKSMYICPEEDCNYKSARLTDINKHKYSHKNKT